MNPKHFSHRRPPWWPEDEPWPPHGPPGPRAWRQMRGRFFWRVGGLFVLMFLFVAGGCNLVLWMAATSLGLIQIQPGPVISTRSEFWVALFLGVVGLFVVGRALRRLAVPIGDLMEAAGRVAEGDYSARVAERGPREVRALARAFNAMAARLQSNEATRRNLLADVTHELRTPLTVIQGGLEGLLDGVYPRDDAHLAPILDETRVLSRLVDDLRMLALAESGALKLQKEPTDVAVLLSEAAASFRAQAAAQSVALSVDAPSDLPLLDLDPERMRQVLSNLIANALRYTPAGGAIRVRAAGGDTSVSVSVSDTGVGIPPEDLPHIFDRFYKSGDSRGMGLGLAIAKNLVAAHGGEIAAHSEPGRGTTIRFTLPGENSVHE
jgi:two-component system OmpR family sensor kinase/two-component system sensor histidine kinase BaeS